MITRVARVGVSAISLGAVTLTVLGCSSASGVASVRQAPEASSPSLSPSPSPSPTRCSPVPYAGPSSAKAYTAYKECLFYAAMPTQSATALPPGLVVPLVTPTSCPVPASELTPEPAQSVTQDTQTSRFSTAASVMAFDSGKYFYKVFGGTEVTGGDRGEVYIVKIALDPCAQNDTNGTDTFELDPTVAGGPISLTGNDGTLVSFTRAKGAAGHIDVATGAWT